MADWFVCNELIIKSIPLVSIRESSQVELRVESFEMNWDLTVVHTVVFIDNAAVVTIFGPVRPLWVVLLRVFLCQGWILFLLVRHLIIRLLHHHHLISCVSFDCLFEAIFAFCQISCQVNAFSCSAHHWCLFVSSHIVLNRKLQCLSLFLDAGLHFLSQLSIDFKVLDL